MKRNIALLLLLIFVLSGILAGCTGASDTDASPGASPASGSPTASAGPASSASPSPAVSLSPEDFVLGTVTAVDGDTITLAIVNPEGTRTITVYEGTAFSIIGSKKEASLSDISAGDVLSVTLSGTTAVKIVNNGPGVDPDPSAYISPSPSETASPSPPVS